MVPSNERILFPGPYKQKIFILIFISKWAVGNILAWHVVYTFRTSSTHCTEILQSLCVSHKIVETYRNQHAPKFSKGKMEWCANGSTDQSHLRMWHLLKTGQNIGQAPWAFDLTDKCSRIMFNQKTQLGSSKPQLFFSPSLIISYDLAAGSWWNLSSQWNVILWHVDWTGWRWTVCFGS
jgi:hypothetical protein